MDRGVVDALDRIQRTLWWIALWLFFIAVHSCGEKRVYVRTEPRTPPDLSFPTKEEIGQGIRDFMEWGG